MSCYWDIGCKTCDVISGALHSDRAEQQMAAWCSAEARKALIGLAGLVLPDVHGDSGVLGLSSSLTQLGTFFKAHEGHDVRPRDEYGRWLGLCTKSSKCQACGNHAPCVLAFEHDGDCSREPVGGDGGIIVLRVEQ